MVDSQRAEFLSLRFGVWSLDYGWADISFNDAFQI